MSTAVLPPTAPLRWPAKKPRNWRALAYAVGMHVLLAALLFVGVRWQSSPPAGAEAELWDDVPEVQSQAVPPAVKAPVPVVEKPVPQQDDAEIALKAEKQRRAQAAAAAAALAQQAQAKAAKAAEQANLIAQQKAEQKAEQAAALKQQREREKKAQEQAKQAQEQAHADRLARLRGAAGAGGSGGAQGTAQGGGGDASPGYADRIRRKVEQNISYRGQTGDGSQTAVVLVRLAPSGEVLSKRLVKPSGVAEWDQTVLRAVDQASPLPRDVDGTIPRKVLQDGIRITFRLRG